MSEKADTGYEHNEVSLFKKSQLCLWGSFLLAYGLYQCVWLPHFELVWNASSSLPQRVFLLVKGETVTRGNYLAFYPPPNPLYGTATPFLKIVGGIAGDKVTDTGGLFAVNGWPIGYAEPYSTNGIRLLPGPTGTIGPNEYFVFTYNPRSYDSRYQEIGWITAKQVVGRAYPVF